MSRKNHTERSTYNAISSMYSTARNLMGTKHLTEQERKTIYQMLGELSVIEYRLRQKQKREQKKMTTSKSAIMCNHANEMPVECPCDDDCYCKEHSCRNRPTKEQLRQATERFVKQAAETVRKIPFEQRTILSKAEARNRPMKYRKKPVVIEAVRITAADYNPLAKDPWDGSPFSEFPDWLEEAVKSETITPHTRNCTDYAEWDIKTLEGTMSASAGDYIIRGVQGELYFCKSDIFKATYEPVEEPRIEHTTCGNA